MSIRLSAPYFVELRALFFAGSTRNGKLHFKERVFDNAYQDRYL